jgi:hypothetical protein
LHTLVKNLKPIKPSYKDQKSLLTRKPPLYGEKAKHKCVQLLANPLLTVILTTTPSNMQWQTTAAAKAKDKVE